jgi:probable F420-dependent oxidoreductase
VKVRIGVSLGPAAVPDGFAAAVDDLERRGADSLWLSEMVDGPLLEPFAGMAYALSRTTRLKVGTGVAVLPGRHPVLVAKQILSLAGLAPGRVLPVFGLRPARPSELSLFPAPPRRRGALFDESLQLLRLLLEQDRVSFAGEFFSVQDVSIGPRPAKPLDIWLGGNAPAALQRIGRLGDGWLGSFITPAEAGSARAAIQDAAAAAGREVDPDHFGVSLAVATEGIPAQLIATARQRRPDADPASLIAATWPDARRMIEEYVAVGLSKFVIRPVAAQPAAEEFIGRFVSEMMPLQD